MIIVLQDAESDRTFVLRYDYSCTKKDSLSEFSCYRYTRCSGSISVWELAWYASGYERSSWNERNKLFDIAQHQSHPHERLASGNYVVYEYLPIVGGLSPVKHGRFCLRVRLY